jgi:hypothetical protein
MKKLLLGIAKFCTQLSMLWDKRFGHKWTAEEILRREG